MVNKRTDDRSADVHTVKWRGGHPPATVEDQETEKLLQKTTNAYLAIYDNRWNERWKDYDDSWKDAVPMVTKGKNAKKPNVCAKCSLKKKKCTGELPACARCVQDNAGAECTYHSVQDDFCLESARSRVFWRHYRIFKTSKDHVDYLSLEDSTSLPLNGIGQAGQHGEQKSRIWTFTCACVMLEPSGSVDANRILNAHTLFSSTCTLPLFPNPSATCTLPLFPNPSATCTPSSAICILPFFPH